MIPVSTELAAAIADYERAPTWRVICDWDRNGLYQHEYSDISGYVTSVKLNRGCSTFSPDDLNEVSGYSSGEITLELGGERDTSSLVEGLTAFELFGGGPNVSPLWGQSTLGVRMQVFVGFQTDDGYEETPLFTGWIREAPVSRQARTVELVANDNLDMVSAQVTLPLWAMGSSSPYATWQNGNPDIARTILLSWVWEETLRQAGRYVAPPLREDTQAHFTMSGSLLPSVGHITDSWATTPFNFAAPFVPEFYAQAPFGYANPRLTGAACEARCCAAQRIIVPMIPNTGNTPWSISFGAWVQTDATDTTGDVMSFMTFLEVCNLGDDVNQADNRARVVMTVSADGTFATAGVSGKPSSGSPTFNRADHSTKRSGWHYYAATIDFAATTITHALSVDGVPVSTVLSGNAGQLSFAAAGSGYPPDNRTNLVRLTTKLPTHHAQAWARPVSDGNRFVRPTQLTVPTLDNGAPLATCTRSLTELSWIPDTYNANTWDVLKDTVGAEWGALWIDARGTVHIIDRSTVNSTAADAIDLDNPEYGDDVVGEITLTPRLDTKRNSITMPGRFRNAVEQIVWQNQNARDYYVPAGIFVDDIAYPLTEVIAVVQKLTADDASNPPDDKAIDVRMSHGTAVKAADVNSAASAGWAFNVRQDHDQRSFYLSVHAQGEDDYVGAYIGANRPSLYVAGRSYSDVQIIQTTVSDTDDIAAWGLRSWSVEESDWRQTSASINALCQNLIFYLPEGTIGISDVDLPHDPSRELFDVVVLTNDAGEGLGELAVQIMGIDTTLDSSGFRDTLSLRLVHTPGVAMWDDVSAGWETAWSA